MENLKLKISLIKDEIKDTVENQMSEMNKRQQEWVQSIRNDVNIMRSDEFQQNSDVCKKLISMICNEVNFTQNRSKLLNLSLVRLYYQYVQNEYENRNEKQIFEDKQFMQDILFWSKYSNAVYEDNKKSVIKLLGISELEIIDYDLQGQSNLCQKYMIIKNESIKTIILTIRGTKTISDAITDLNMDVTEFFDGKVHKGIFIGSERLYQKIKGHLERVFIENPGYKLVINGHSLGGGASILMTLILKSKQLSGEFNKDVVVRCVAFAPPAVYQGKLPDNISKQIDVLINSQDIVPSFSMKGLYLLGLEMNLIDQYDMKNSDCLKYLIQDQEQDIIQKLYSKLDSNYDVFKKEIYSKFEQLHQVGNIYHMTKNQDQKYVTLKQDHEQFQRMKLLPKFVHDHGMACYIQALNELTEDGNQKEAGILSQLSDKFKQTFIFKKKPKFLQRIQCYDQNELLVEVSQCEEKERNNLLEELKEYCKKSNNDA